MWPFKKKDKQSAETSDMWKKLDTLQYKPKCPRPECLCYDCPSRGGCSAEKEMRASGACLIEGGPRFLSCSWKKHLKGEFNAKKESAERRPTGGIIAVDRLDDPCLSSFDEVPTVQG